MMRFISHMLSESPIMTDLRHALDAYMARNEDDLSSVRLVCSELAMLIEPPCPAVVVDSLSLSTKSSSSMSFKLSILLLLDVIGTHVSITRLPTFRF